MSRLYRTHTQTGGGARAALFAVAALGVHLLLLALLGPLLPEAEPPQDRERAERSARDDDGGMRVRMVEPEEPERREPDEERLPYRTLAPPERETTPEEATILDRFSESVEEESVRRDVPAREPGAVAEQQMAMRAETPSPEPRRRERSGSQRDRRRGPEEREPEREPAETAGEARAEQRPVPREPSESSERPPVILPETWEAMQAREGGGATERGEGAQSAERDAPSSGASGEAIDPSELFPDASSAKRAQLLEEGRGDTRQFLRDIEPGERNLLNRKKTRYWAFFDRVVDATRKQWVPRVRRAYRKRDPDGDVYGTADRLTVLRITLSGDGSVRKIYVERSCDLEFMDEIAVTAIQKAAPFPNPPEGLKDEDGQIQFDFAFLFDIETGSLRWLRGRPPRGK